MRDRTNITIVIRQDVRYCHRMVYCECCTSLTLPTFSRSHILKCEYLENSELAKKCSSKTFIEVNICHRMGPLQMLYSVTCPKFQGQTFIVAIWQGWKHANIIAIKTSGICHRMAPRQMIYIMTFTCIFKVANFEMWISRKRWEIAKNAHECL